MKKIIPSFIIVIACLLFISCSSTPASRIKENAELYYNLPMEQRQLVKQGQISRGMTPAAVFLAWGNPSSIAEGNLDGKQSTRWLYTALEPVFVPGAGGGYWGPWGPYRHHYWGGYYNDVAYVPVNSGYALFINGLVEEWEKRP